MIKVMLADQYDRLMFGELHDRLLNEVMAADAQARLTLMNTVAKEPAQQLLNSADDYFYPALSETGPAGRARPAR